MTSTVSLSVPALGAVEVTLTERGEGHHVLVLHGGGGPLTVSAWADAYAAAAHAHVITPVHPGFNGTPRPESLDSVEGLAALYVALLDRLDLQGVTVVGNSIGGWIAAEMAILGSPRVGGYVLVDAVGVEVPGHGGPDFFTMTPAELAAHSYADPDRYGLDPAKLPPAAQAVMAANRVAIAVYGGDGMTDPTLAARLATVATPTVVVWGEADRIRDPEVGRAFAAAVPGAGFVLLAGTGHLPQIETPEALTEVVRAFVAERVAATPAG